jgi:FHA domain
LSDLRETLKPSEVVAAALTMGRHDFADSFGQEPVLLVNLQGHDPSFLTALIECPTDPNGPWYPRSETTGTGTMVTGGMSADEVRRLVASLPPPMNGSALADLLASPHFVVPLRKRGDSTFEERITIGRSHSNDVVLFHDSVSKEQAWLEHDDSGRLFVCDMRSTNFTYVNGRMVDPMDLVYFRYGDLVTFGEVQTRACTPELLWDAIDHLGGPSRVDGQH